jgi:hypothetical protein
MSLCGISSEDVGVAEAELACVDSWVVTLRRVDLA